jgi:glycosyltransferase involved in cell wall biosynthesis
VTIVAPVDEFIHYLDELKGVQHIAHKQLSRKGINPLRELQLANELRKIFRQQRPDLVINFTIKPNIYSNLAAKWCGIPSICVVTGQGYTLLHEGWLKKLVCKLYKLSFRFANAVVFENSDDAKDFVHKGLVNKYKVAVVNGPGVDTLHFSPGKPLDERDPVFLFLGRLLYDKGIVEFVEAAKKLKQHSPKAKFWVAGELDEGNPSCIDKSLLIDWIESGVVQYFGNVNDVRFLLDKTTCVVLPSYREGCSRVLLEGLSMGCALISTNTPGCKDIIDQGTNGYLVPVGNITALTLAMESVLHLPAHTLLQWQAASRKKAIKTYDDQHVALQYLNIINNIIPLPKDLTTATSPSTLLLENKA